MDFIAKDVIGPFEITRNGNQYALTIVCKIKNYVLCKLIPDKTANIIVYT